MKVLTLNLNGYNESKRYEKLELICEKIIEEDIDVICLQEVTQYYIEDIIYDDVRSGNLAYIMQLILKKQFNVEYDLEVKMFERVKECYDEGIAILAKHKLEASESYVITALTRQDDIRYALLASYEGYQIVCTHLNNPTIEPDYEIQVNKLLNGIDLTNNVVICGDMNATPLTVEYETLISKGLFDLVKETNRTVSEMPTHLKYGIRIDYILSNFKDATHCKALFTKGEVSDHLAIMIEI